MKIQPATIKIPRKSVPAPLNIKQCVFQALRSTRPRPACVLGVSSHRDALQKVADGSKLSPPRQDTCLPMPFTNSAVFGIGADQVHISCWNDVSSGRATCNLAELACRLNLEPTSLQHLQLATETGEACVQPAACNLAVPQPATLQRSKKHRPKPAAPLAAHTS